MDSRYEPTPEHPSGENRHTAKKKPQGMTVGRGVRTVGSVIGRTFLTIFFIMVITGSIVASVLTVYVIRSLENETEFDLRNVQGKFTSTMYAVDKETQEPYPLQVVRGDENRIWVDFGSISPELQLATRAAEDKRFLMHQGVDWKLTAVAFVNQFFPIRDNVVGGSTITQQLIKNISGDREVSPVRKIREIFRALALEKEYSKDDIMEAYLNTIALGNNTAGVQAAANLYFGKEASELSTAECAAIIAITQNPSKWELFQHEEENRNRRGYILDNMLDIELAKLDAQHDGKPRSVYGDEISGAKLSDSEYKEKKQALEQKYKDAKAQTLTVQSNAAQETRYDVYSYFVDYVIDEVIKDMGTQLGYTPAYALDLINNGGLSIYTTVDESIQDLLDEKFITNEINYDPQTSIFPQVTGRYINRDGETFGDSLGDKQPQCAMVIMDYEGNIKGVAGGRGEKKNDLAFNLATDGKRQAGSAIKPLSVYGPALDLDLINWSYKITDSPFLYKTSGGAVQTHEMTADATAAMAGGWPINYYGSYMGPITVDLAIQRSCNTVAVKTLDMLTPRASYEFLTNNLGITTLDEKRDIDYAPLALGAMSGGVSVLDMTAAYQIFGNGGLYYEPHAYTKVVDNQGNVILEADTIPRRVIAQDTAEVMNKLLNRVTTGPNGTGTGANLGNMTTIGKTGTSSMDKDQWFMGATPYYVSGVWFGYDKENAGIKYRSYPPPIIWKRIMAEVHKGLPNKAFPSSGAVVERTYCMASGDLASPTCAETGSGWYKESALPPICTGLGEAVAAEDVTNQGDVLTDEMVGWGEEESNPDEIAIEGILSSTPN